MTTKPPGKPEFVRKIFEEGVRYMDQLLEENERLRLALAQERDTKRATSEEEVARLRAQLTLALEDGASARRQLDALRTELTRVAAENNEFAEACVALQEKQAALSSLYAASYELHASLDLQSVLQSLFEIVVNLLGSESFAIYLTDDRMEELRIAMDLGLPPTVPRTLRVGHGTIGQALYTPDSFVELPPDPAPDEPLVLVPFRVRDQGVGVLSIFRFLPQKKGISDLDRELFRLMSAQASTALHGASLYAKSERRAATFEGLVELVRGKAMTR